MLVLQGVVDNVYLTPKGTTKEGDPFGGHDKVQMLVKIPQAGGTFRKEFVDLKTEQGSLFKQNEGNEASVPVGAFAPGKGRVIFFQNGDPVFPNQPDQQRGKSAA